MFWDCQCSVWWAEHEPDPQNEENNTCLDSAPNEEEFIQPRSNAKGENKRSYEKHRPRDVKKSFRWSRVSPSAARRRENEKKHDQHRELSQQLASLSTPDVSLYRELICRYNHRDLTYNQDVLRAFSGVLDAFARGFTGGFVSGIPALFLDSALLWQPLRKAKRRVATLHPAAPPSPIPSWSWVGWQCLIDPESLRSCMDYSVEMCGDDGTSWPRGWTTSKLVDWQVMRTTDDIPQELKDGPALLERYKRFETDHGAEGLPDGWSVRTGLERLERSTLFDQETRQTTWFLHRSQDDSLYRYPLPIKDASSTEAVSEEIPFLSCETTAAEFRIRYVHLPGRIPIISTSFDSLASVTVLDTDLYKNESDTEAYCPVITLEDRKGRWAGVMRIMEDSPGLCAGATAKAVAVSRGSCSYWDAVSTYEAAADRGGRYNDYCYFKPLSPPSWVPEPVGPGIELFGIRGPPAIRMVKRDDQDKGPIFPPGLESVRGYHRHKEPKEWYAQTYEFYNVLWVEQIGGIMYRKAAGHVPKDIWEDNWNHHGARERIVLG